jgi:PAS domain S-box-containing protein
LPHGGHHEKRVIKTLLLGEDAGRLRAIKEALEEYDDKLIVDTESRTGDAIDSLRLGEYDTLVACCGVKHPTVAGLLKASAKLRRTPVVIFSCDSDGASILRAFKMGVRDYVLDEGSSGYKALAARVRLTSETWRDSMRDSVTLQLLNAVNEAKNPVDSVESALTILNELTGAEALAIRLRNKGDYPYYATKGFPQSHVELESSLLKPGEAAVLDCMCGHVIQGRSESDRPFYTPAGSFWTGSSTRLAKELGAESSKLLCRANCLKEGYESLALIPLRNGDEVIGLLQVNDRREGFMTVRLVSFLEELASGISLAMTKADAERTLRESEELFRKLIENTNDPISISVDNVIVYANKRRAELSGYKDPSKLIGRRRDEFADGEDAEKLRDMFGEQSNSIEQPNRYEYKMKTHSGGTIYVEASYTPIVFHGQNAAINILRDVTESRKYQEKIAALHSHAAALASAEDLKSIVKTTLDACQKALGFNFLAFLVVKDDDLVTIGNRGVKPPRNILPLNGKGITVKAVHEKQSILVNDVRGSADFLRGTLSSQSELATPVVVAGEVVAIINVEDNHRDAFTDMDRVLLETLASHVATAMYRLRHLEEDAKAQEARTRDLLESANRVTAMVQHDMRGPLQTIKSASFLINADPKKAAMLTQTIDQSVDYATKILDDLKNNTTPVKLQQTLVNLKDIVEDRVNLLNRGENIKVKTVFETEFLAATVDPERIRRVLDNLLKNAVEAMPNGGRLNVNVGKRGDNAVIEVKDTGAGIPPEVMANLFTPFYSGKKGGTGLGLAFSKQAVEAHGGKIQVKTKVGKGTTFRVLIPLTAQKNEEPIGPGKIPKPKSRAP